MGVHSLYIVQIFLELKVWDTWICTQVEAEIKPPAIMMHQRCNVYHLYVYVLHTYHLYSR